MNPSSPVNWYVQGPSLVLAAAIYLLIARLVLDLAFGFLGNNILFRALRSITNPIVSVIGSITPRIVPAPLLTGAAIVWLLAARVLLVQVAAAMAMRRMMG
jgi:hypothetical protein